MKTASWNLIISVTRWLVRGLVVGVLLLWGAFFVGHTWEWFIAPFPNHPPLKMCIGQALHLLLLLGLLASLRWPGWGAAWVAVTAFAFFVDKAGANFPLFFGFTVAPVFLLLFCAWLEGRMRRRQTAAALPA